MNDFLILSITCTIIGMLAPASRESGLGKCIAYLAGLMLMLAISVPISENLASLSLLPERFLSLILPDSKEIETAEKSAEEWVIHYSKENIESEVEKLIENRFGLSEGSVNADAAVAKDPDTTFVLESIKVTLVPDAIISEETLADYVSNILGCPCEVIVTSLDT